MLPIKNTFNTSITVDRGAIYVSVDRDVPIHRNTDEYIDRNTL